MKNTKIPQKYIDNLNLIKDIMTSSNMMEHFDYNTAKNVITIWKKIPNYLKTNTYICEFYNELNVIIWYHLMKVMLNEQKNMK